MTMSLASWIALLIFIAVIVSSILALVIGFYRGLFKTSIKTFIKAGFIVFWIFSTPAIARSFSNIDLTRFGIPNFIVNNTTITVTTVSETVANIITALKIVSPINGLSIYSLIVTITHLIICYGVFFVMMFLSNLLIDIVALLIYNGVFRWFYQVETFKENYHRLKNEREYKKNSRALSVLAKGLLNSDGTIFDKKSKKPLLKLGGAILGFAVQFVFALIICSPITAIFRIAENNKEDVFAFTKTLAPSTIKTIDDTSNFIDDFASSALSKIYTLPGGYYLDSLIMNKVSSQKIYGYEINLDSLISSITDVANPIMTSDSISYQEGLSYVTYNYATLLSVSTIDAMLSSILLPKNSSFYALIPPLIDVGLAMISANTEFTLDILDFSDIDWSNDIEAIQKIYDKIYPLTINTIIDGKDINPYNFVMKTSTYDDSTISTLCDAARIVGSTNVINKNAPVILNSLGTTLSAYGYDLFPTETEAYKDIDWGEEFYIFAKGLFRLLRLIEVDIQANMNFNFIQEQLVKAFKVKEKRVVLRDIILGEDGLLNSNLFSLLKKGDTVLVLLNSFLSDNTSGINSYISNEKFIESVKTFNNKDVSEIRLEVSYMFSIIDILAEPSNPIHWDDNFSFTLRENFDQATAQEIYDLLQIAKNSIVFSSVYPVILKSYLINNYSEQQVKDFLFGLTPYNFNYDDENFVNDISRVILSMPKIVNLYQKIESNTATRKEKIEALDVESIRIFLDVIANSNFFNPNIKYIQKDIEAENINMEVVLNKLFNSEIFSSLNFVLPSREKIATANWGNGTISNIRLPSGKEISMPQDEIGNICLMIKSIKDNTDYFSLNLDTLHLADLDHINSFESIFDLASATVNSDLFRESGVNSIVSKFEKYFEGKNVNFSFNDLRNYAYEEKNKYKLLDDLYSLKIISALFKKLEYNKLASDPIPYLRTIDSDEFNVFLTTLTMTNYSQDSLSDPMANFIYLSLHKFGIFDKYNLPDLSPDVFSVKQYANCSWIISTEEKVFNINENEYVFTLTSIGSVRNICSLFNKLKNDFYLSKIKEGDYSSLDFRTYIQDEITRENTYGASVLSDMYIRKLTDIYGRHIVKKLSNIIKDIPSFFFDAYKYIDSSLVYGSDALDGVTMGQSLYDINEALVLLTKKVNDNELVASRMSQFDKLFSLNNIEGEEDLVNQISNNFKALGRSKLLSTRARNNSFSPFGYYMYSLTEKNVSYSKYLVMGGENNASNLSKIKGIISEIDNKDISNDLTTNWEKEFTNYSSLILNGNNINYSFFDYSFNKEVEPLRNIYDSLNNSLFLHQYLIYRIKRICADFNLDNFLKDSSSRIIHPIRFDVHLTNSDEDTKYYSHDYNLIFDILSNDNYGAKNILTNKTMPEYLDSSNAEIIYLFSSLNILENNYNYIIYNLLNTTLFKLTNYLSNPTIYYYQEEAKATRIKEVMKNNPYFNKDDDLELLKGTLDHLFSVKDKSYSSLSDIKNNFDNNFFTSLFENTYIEDYRSYLASELVAGLITNMFNAAEEISSYFSPYSAYNYYKYNNQDYYYINGDIGLEIDNLINQ